MFIISRNKLKPKKFKDYDGDFVMKIIKSERNNRPHRRQLIIKQLKELKRIMHNLNKMTQTDSPEEKGVQVEMGSDDLRTIRMNDGDTKGKLLKMSLLEEGMPKFQKALTGTPRDKREASTETRGFYDVDEKRLMAWTEKDNMSRLLQQLLDELEQNDNDDREIMAELIDRYYNILRTLMGMGYDIGSVIFSIAQTGTAFGIAVSPHALNILVSIYHGASAMYDFDSEIPPSGTSNNNDEAPIAVNNDQAIDLTQEEVISVHSSRHSEANEEPAIAPPTDIPEPTDVESDEEEEEQPSSSNKEKSTK